MRRPHRASGRGRSARGRQAEAGPGGGVAVRGRWLLAGGAAGAPDPSLGRARARRRRPLTSNPSGIPVMAGGRAALAQDPRAGQAGLADHSPTTCSTMTYHSPLAPPLGPKSGAEPHFTARRARTDPLVHKLPHFSPAPPEVLRVDLNLAADQPSRSPARSRPAESRPGRQTGPNLEAPVGHRARRPGCSRGRALDTL